MIITETINKKLLEKIVQESFSTFGDISTSKLLDSLKFLGFYYATNSGLSITIEDLNSPDSKKDLINKAKQEINDIDNFWQEGSVSDIERFQCVIDSWNLAAENLKNNIIDYYNNLDPANNLYIMAFSGARGNISQVRQLVGMRGLMADQEGKIIDIPIQSNFREGLTSVDYLISSYGARKGIVDTALKTADSGYLTRRLVYLAQDLVIREIDCKTQNGIIILLNKNTNSKLLLGKTIFSRKFLKSFQKSTDSFILTESRIEKMKQEETSYISVRSPLTCQSNGSICQKCYGWDLAQNKLISLGESVGVIAAQSIGEPGTQLTMRTFHTGGIFTNEILKPILASSAGKLIIPHDISGEFIRTNHGRKVFQIQNELSLTFVTLEGKTKIFFLMKGSFLYYRFSTFLKKGDLIAETSTKSLRSTGKKLKPIYNSLEGEIRIENLQQKDKITNKIEEEISYQTDGIIKGDGLLWINSGKICTLPKEQFYKFPKILKKSKAFSILKIISPYKGVIEKLNNEFFLWSIEINSIFKFRLEKIKKKIPNCMVKLSFLEKNYQYIDNYTIVAFLQIFSIFEEKIYCIKRKTLTEAISIFFITESDIWKLNLDQIDDYRFYFTKESNLKKGTIFTKNSKVVETGYLLKKDGLNFLFQKSFPRFLPDGTILNSRTGDLLIKNDLLVTLVNYTQQTEDIVQGLPKIEELIEARITKEPSVLSQRPGIFFNSLLSLQNITSKENTLYVTYKKKRNKVFKEIGEVKEKKKILIQVLHSFQLTGRIISFNNNFYRLFPLPPTYAPIKNKRKKTQISFVNFKKNKLKIKNNTNWIQDNRLNEFFFFNCINYNFIPCRFLSEKENLFKSKKEEDYVLKGSQNNWFFLELITSGINYKVPKSSEIILKSNHFIDIGEQLTNGDIHPHQLLALLFFYHTFFETNIKAVLHSLNKFQLILLNSIQGIYQSQGITISNKHIELIVRQMTAKVTVMHSGDSPLYPGEQIELSLMIELDKTLFTKHQNSFYKLPKYQPLFFSTVNASLNKDGFIAAAGFQETKRILTKAAIEGTIDLLRGLKESVIIGRLVPTGSSFLNYKNNLDEIYEFYTKQKEERKNEIEKFKKKRKD